MNTTDDTNDENGKNWNTTDDAVNDGQQNEDGFEYPDDREHDPHFDDVHPNQVMELGNWSILSEGGDASPPPTDRLF